MNNMKYSASEVFFPFLINWLIKNKIIGRLKRQLSAAVFLYMKMKIFQINISLWATAHLPFP